MKTAAIIVAALAGSIASPAFAGDIEPGQWELTITLEGGPLASGKTQEVTRTRCFTPEDSRDLVRTLKSTAEEDDCQDSQVSRDGDTITHSASCPRAGRGMASVEGSMTLHDARHFTSETHIGEGEDATHVTTEARWIDDTCEG
ncbi:DUF3617 family protein [Modicisalibacter sp. MOD 31.J]|uniref:DUF3617 domain-containing protein n=1 Tax=Modicisalibacter sp. MOD 31.J TaxID=2831897 RepID=UPI001CCDE80F|nr:DUF3617 family protein [Modicisalibacter sp. MOD 31.J]MBZ9573724.1 DUF3617 family protein [Modicisalibacter sp. MOD 31.J]